MDAFVPDADVRSVFASKELVGLAGLTPVPKTTDFTCAAAAVATCLRYVGQVANEYQCAEALGTNRVVGATAPDILKYLSGRELYATAWKNYPVRRMIERIVLGKLVMVDWGDWGGHWTVVAGYDPSSNAIVFADPARPRGRFSAFTLDHFTRCWVRPESENTAHQARQLVIDIDRPSIGKSRAGVEPEHKHRTDFRIQDWNKGVRIQRRAAVGAAQA
jgi:ABC-type bacteriocin/lantibiotic exporter with double-glycine peptidase domain